MSPTSVPQPGSPDAERALAITRLAASLPPPLGQVAVYAWLDQMPRAEIAAILGCSESHVRVLLRRAAGTLRSEADDLDVTSAR